MGACGGIRNNRWARRENWQESFEDRCAANGVTELNSGGDSETGNLLCFEMKCCCNVR
jgi:hypothetical protein